METSNDRVRPVLRISPGAAVTSVPSGPSVASLLTSGQPGHLCAGPEGCFSTSSVAVPARATPGRSEWCRAPRPGRLRRASSFWWAVPGGPGVLLGSTSRRSAKGRARWRRSWLAVAHRSARALCRSACVARAGRATIVVWLVCLTAFPSHVNSNYTRTFYDRGSAGAFLSHFYHVFRVFRVFSPVFAI